MATDYLADANEPLPAAVTSLASSGVTATGVTTQGEQVCFPRNSLFEVSSITDASTTPAGAGQGDTLVSNMQLVSGHFSPKSGYKTFPGYKTFHWPHSFKYENKTWVALSVRAGF